MKKIRHKQKQFAARADELTLPDGKGTLTATLRVTGPLAVLVAKSQALVGPTATISRRGP